LEIVQRCIVWKPVSVLALLALFMGALTFPAIADDSKTVNATVTPIVIAVNVDPPTLSYGTKEVGKTAQIPNPPGFVATNSGSVPENFLIRGAASTPGGWILASTAGANAYVHRYKVNGAGSFAPITTTAAQIHGNLSPSSSVVIDLELDMPITTTSVVEQTLPVTIVATQAMP
jgi:hypothetical protein